MKEQVEVNMIFFMVILNIHTTYAHNILRLNDQRSAKFVLRHDGMVPNKPPYLEFQADSLPICFDRCVADTPCKSINYNSTIKTCQHVDYDINDGKDYGIKAGWQHYDTGRTKLTRILDGTQNYCITGTMADPCNPDTTSSYHQLYYKSITSASCTGIEAYFEFDETYGTIMHHCSGWVMLLSVGNIVLKTPPELNGDLLTNEVWRWRKNSHDHLDMNHRAIYPYNGLSDGALARHMDPHSIPGSESHIILDRITHAVKFEMMYPITFSHLDNFESEFRSKFANGYQRLIYQSDFLIYPAMGSRYAVRMQALFSPDVTGTYTFWLRGDDWALLFIGNDESPASRQFVAERRGAYGPYHIGATGTKFLEKEKLYYMELLFHEGEGSDFIVLSMQRPGDEDRIIVSSDHLYPLP